MTDRRWPKWQDLRPLLQPAPVQFNRTQARLGRAADVADLRRIAKRVTPRAAFDYVEGAANSEEGARRNAEAYSRIELRPHVLCDVGEVDLSVEILGRKAALPVGIAPTGFTRMMHSAGEIAGARSAGRAGVPFALSTIGTTSIEDLAVAAPDTRRWFQLYLWRDRRELSEELLARASGSGYDVLLVTVDTATGGLRYRDVRNGMTIPPRISLRTALDASYRPRWWFDFLTTEPLTFATLTQSTAHTSEVIGRMFDATLNYEDLTWIRQAWSGPLVVKGIQTVDDARKALDHGVDGLYLSNHGGRQLDRSPVPLQVLPEVRAAVGPDVPIIVDSGISSGGDILGALALGANFTMIGRSYLYGLMAGGQAGVDRVFDILRHELQVTLQLMGTRSVRDLTGDDVRLNWRT